MSDDGRHGITLIVFVGSVFSTRYARARRAGPADPLDFCAINVALYGPNRRWVMTERPAHAWHAAEHDATLGPSAIGWNGDALECRFDERSAPLGMPVRGSLRLIPTALTGERVALEPSGEHRWFPVAPTARIEVNLTEPRLAFRGHGYHDANQGDSALATRFRRWDWCRARSRSGSHSVVVYDRVLADGSASRYAARFDTRGGSLQVDLPHEVALGRTPWGIERRTRAGVAGGARVRRTLEDSPFYARSLVETTLHGERALAVHESLSLERFEQPWVQFFLPFKIRYAS